MSAHASYVDESGVTMEWDEERHAFFPKIDENLVAAFQQQYQAPAAAVAEDDPWEQQTTPDGKVYYYNKVTGKAQWTDPHPKVEPKAKKSEAAKPKRKLEEKQFFTLKDENNPHVYVSGLPLDISEQEFHDLMARCGILAADDEGNKKIKLYRTPDGALKGDGRCCYLKTASVPLALQLLDGSDVRGHTIRVERAKFQQKSDFDPSARAALPKKKPQKKKSTQDKLLSWNEAPAVRAKAQGVVVIKHMFDPREFEQDPTYLNDLRMDVQSECEKFGPVKKVLIFDRHPEGVISVRFAEEEAAEKCIERMHGRFFAGRRLAAEACDGVTNYQIEETEEEREQRLKQWEAYLQGEERKKEAAAAAAAAAGEKERGEEEGGSADGPRKRGRQEREEDGEEEEEEEEED